MQGCWPGLCLPVDGGGEPANCGMLICIGGMHPPLGGPLPYSDVSLSPRNVPYGYNKNYLKLKNVSHYLNYGKSLP